jgi:hypothetical protein
MNKDILTKVLVGFGISALVVGIIYYLKKGVFDLMEIGFNVSGLTIRKISLQEITLGLNIDLDNPSNLGFTVTAYNIAVEIQNRQVAIISGSNMEAIIPPKGKTTIPIQFSFKPADLGINLALLGLDLFATDQLNSEAISKLPIRYVGTLTGRFGVLDIKNIPIDYTYQPQ